MSEELAKSHVGKTLNICNHQPTQLASRSRVDSGLEVIPSLAGDSAAGTTTCGLVILAAAQRLLIKVPDGSINRRQLEEPVSVSSKGGRVLCLVSAHHVAHARRYAHSDIEKPLNIPRHGSMRTFPNDIRYPSDMGSPKGIESPKDMRCRQVLHPPDTRREAPLTLPPSLSNHSCRGSVFFSFTIPSTSLVS